jgi:DNA (cytosine-5)-methyltransferase 1
MIERIRKWRVLNLYAGLGGNRRLWTNVDVTAIENNESIAKFYKDHFPNDNLIITDAHQYLLEHYNEYDFIWSSINCPTHSRARFWSAKPNKKVKPVFPDMKLYEEILFLKHYFNGKWVVENVVPFYTPLIEPSVIIGRHCFWSNFHFNHIDVEEADINRGNKDTWQALHNVDISKYSFTARRDKVLRNCVNSYLGLHILNCARNGVKELKEVQKPINKYKNPEIIFE